jgi:hypothetical protein
MVFAKPAKKCWDATKKQIEECCKLPTVEDLIDKLEKDIWPEFRKLLPKDNEKQKQQFQDFAEKFLNQQCGLDKMDPMYNTNSAKSLMEDISENKKENYSDEVEMEMAEQEVTEEQLTAQATVKVYKSDLKPIPYEVLLAEVKPYLNYFKKKFYSILRDNNNDTLGGNYISGKLNHKKLYKWKCNSVRLFQKKIMKKNKHYAFSLLIDTSGSMYGKEIKAATLGAVLFAEALDYCKVPFEILGFDRVIKTYKEIDQPFNWTVKRNIEQFIPETGSEDSGYTSDAAAINRSGMRMSKLVDDNAQKFIIVLTDGQSNPSDEEFSKQDLRFGVQEGKLQMWDYDVEEEVIRALKKGISTICLGIETNAGGRYNDFREVEKIEELPVTICNILKSKIKRK